jgi:hypothetical protein
MIAFAIFKGRVYVDGMGQTWQCDKVMIENSFSIMVPYPIRGHNEPHVRRWVETNTGKWSPHPSGADMVALLTL